MGRCVEPNSTADEGLELDEGEPNTNNPPPPPPPSPPPDSTENDKEQTDGDEVELRDEVELQRERAAFFPEFIAGMHLDPKFPPPKLSDAELAVRETKAAEQGGANAQFNLGCAYREGKGVPQSYERAVKLFKLSSAQGYAKATTNLAGSYGNGHGVDQSYAEARRLYELAVAQGEVKFAPGHLQRLNERIQQYCPLLGQLGPRVALRGLTTAALNGTRGTAIDFGFSERDPETGKWFADSGRYTVRLDGPEGRLVKVRVANVHAGLVHAELVEGLDIKKLAASLDKVDLECKAKGEQPSPAFRWLHLRLLDRLRCDKDAEAVGGGAHGADHMDTEATGESLAPAASPPPPPPPPACGTTTTKHQHRDHNSANGHHDHGCRW